MADDPYKIAPRTLLLAERAKAERRYSRILSKVLSEIERMLKVRNPKTPSQFMRFWRQIVESPQFDDLCEQASRQIVTMLAVGQKHSWRAAATASSEGRAIYKALTHEMETTPLGQMISQIVEENARLIKTVPQDMAQEFSKMAQESYTKGMRPDQIVEEMMGKAPNLRRYEAQRIARTESSKASTALIQARAEIYDRPFYYWRTCNDERTRASHRKMEGVICRWSDPPDPEAIAGEKSYGNYHPGGIYNCRCIPEPIVSIDRIKFPAKVHISGRIETVKSPEAFRRLFGLA